MEKKTGEIIFPSEKCKIFHQTTVTLGWVVDASCEWKCRVGGAVQEDLSRVCPVSEAKGSLQSQLHPWFTMLPFTESAMAIYIEAATTMT